MFNITKTFLFNEIELLTFCIYLDKLAWDNSSFSTEDFMYLLALAVKVKLTQPSNQSLLIENIKTENAQLYLRYNKWLEENNLFPQIKITEKDLNAKFKALSRVMFYYLFYIFFLKKNV